MKNTKILKTKVDSNIDKSEEEFEQDFAFASAAAQVDGVAPSEDAKRIMHLYYYDEIDYETAQSMIENLYKQQ